MGEMHNFTPSGRPCPLCGASNKERVIVLNAQGVLNSNWSYHKDRFAKSGVAPDEKFSIQRCSECFFVYSSVIPSPDFLGFVYDQLIDIEAAGRESYSPNNIAARMEYLPVLLRLLRNGGKVLDYGCGFGPALSLLGNIRGVNAVGFEPSAARVREIEDRYPLVTMNFDKVREYGPFNAVILDNVLEHVPDPRQTMNMVRSICAEDAFLYVSVPDINSRYLRSQMALNQRNKPLAMDINPWEHLNYFDLAHLDTFMSSMGFVPIKQMDIPSEVRVGLRPEKKMLPRLKNTLASMLRGLRYVLTGEGLSSANRRFYRLNDRSTAKPSDA